MSHIPELDPSFVPAIKARRDYAERIANASDAKDVQIALERPDGSVFRHCLRLAHSDGETPAIFERHIKFLLWMQGGSRMALDDQASADILAKAYSPIGTRGFDDEIIARKIFGESFQIRCVPTADLPEANASAQPLGRHLEGCRIGFDLGGSDRKCAALIDGKVVFSEEIEWSPYFEKDPQYHIAGIQDSLERAAKHLPRVDAIGGSAAGVYVNNAVRVASLFRGVSDEDFDRVVKTIFLDVQKKWNVPLEVVNDGEVTALAGSMSMNANGVLGISMGTSLAAGYVTPEGSITPWLNELAFAPIDYRQNGPVDEWSGDEGCGVQYFSQQGMARLAPLAGFDFPADMPLPEQLIHVQDAMKAGDERAAKIYRTIGVCFGYTIAHWADFYDIEKLLILGRVTSGEGGNVIIAEAENVLRSEFPALASAIDITTPNEKDKRHGQAIAAGSLPALPVTTK